MAPSISLAVKVLLAVSCVALFRLIPVKQILDDALVLIQDQGDLGPVYYSIFLSIWVAALLPCSVLEVVPGFLFGFKTGFVCSVVGKNLGNLWSLLLGRYLLKAAIQEKLIARYPKLKAIERAIEHGGFKVLVMIRFTYLPMVLKNYGVSVLNIAIWKVLVAGLISGIPFAVMWSFVGSSATNLNDIVEGKFSMRDALPEENRDIVVLVAVSGVILSAFVGVLWSFTKELKVALQEAQTQLDVETKKKSK